MINGEESHLEVSELMPWFVNGTLGQDKGLLVREHIEVCTECRGDYAFMRRVNSAVNRTAPAPIVPRPPVDVFLSELDNTQKAQRWTANRPAWALAASVVAAVAVVTLFARDWQTDPAGSTQFDTVTSTQGVASMDYVLRVNFEPDSVAVDRNAVIESIGGRDVTPGEDENSIRLVVSVSGSSVADVERFTATVTARHEVRSVDIVALQLPVRNTE